MQITWLQEIIYLNAVTFLRLFDASQGPQIHDEEGNNLCKGAFTWSIFSDGFAKQIKLYEHFIGSDARCVKSRLCIMSPYRVDYNAH